MKATEITTKMKEQTIGVEIEMAEITRRDAIGVVAAYYGTETTIEYEGRGYSMWTCLDTKGRKWQVMSDGSLHSSVESGGAELTTPILRYDDIADLQEIVRRLRRAGAVSNPRHGCGVHIHIGADGHTAQSLRNLTNIMAAHEDLLAAAIYMDPERRASYCKPTSPEFLREVNAKKPTTMKELADIWYETQPDWRHRSGDHYHTSRYHMLNLHATFTKGTIEFRLFQFDNPHGGRKGGLHAGRLKAYIHLALALSQAAKMVKRANPAKQTTDNPKYAMRCWLLRLGFIGDEFATTRDHLTQKLKGDAAFRHGRPERRTDAA